MDNHFLMLYTVFWLAVFGAVVGSFLACAAGRWANGESALRGRSRCDSCGRTLAPRDLVPVLSYLLAKGKCRFCGAEIPRVCLYAELAGAAAFAAVGLKCGLSPALGQWVIVAALLLALSLTDIQKKIIPDRLLLAIAANRVFWVLLLGQDAMAAGKAFLLSALVSFLPLLALVLLMDKFLQKETMGGGDLKLLLVMALYLNWMEIWLALLLASLLGIIWFICGRRRGAVAFGPFLAAGCLLAATAGQPLVIWYGGLLL